MSSKYLYICEYPSGSMVDKNLKALCERVRERFSYLNESHPELLSDRWLSVLHNTKLHSFLTNTGYLQRNVFGKGRSGMRIFIFSVNDVTHISLWDYEFSISRMQL